MTCQSRKIGLQNRFSIVWTRAWERKKRLSISRLTHCKQNCISKIPSDTCFICKFILSYWNSERKNNTTTHTLLVISIFENRFSHFTVRMYICAFEWNKWSAHSDFCFISTCYSIYSTLNFILFNLTWTPMVRSIEDKEILFVEFAIVWLPIVGSIEFCVLINTREIHRIRANVEFRMRTNLMTNWQSESNCSI